MDLKNDVLHSSSGIVPQVLVVSSALILLWWTFIGIKGGFSTVREILAVGEMDFPFSNQFWEDFRTVDNWDKSIKRNYLRIFYLLYVSSDIFFEFYFLETDLPQSVVYQNEEGKWVTDLAYYTSFNKEQDLNVSLSKELSEDFRSGCKCVENHCTEPC